MRATKIKLLDGCYKSTNLLEIDEIYITGEKEGYFKKEFIYDLVSEDPEAVQVDIFPYPYLRPALLGEMKYVRSAPDDAKFDSLLRLPRG